MKNKELLDAIKAKDDKILEVIKTIRMTLKKVIMKLFVEKYHQFTQNLKDLIDVRRK
jgi:hypothetical protein